MNTETDHAALESDVIVEWIPVLRAFARSLTRDPDSADDLLQDTLLRAIRYREKFQPGTNLRAWLLTIMRNTFYSRVKREARERTGVADCVSHSVSVQPSQDLSVQSAEVMDAIGRLPDHYREMLVLVVMLGESYETSARICDCAIGTVKSRVNRARALVVQDLHAGNRPVPGRG